MEVRELKLICDEWDGEGSDGKSLCVCSRQAHGEHGEQQMEDVQREEDAARMEI